MGVHTTHYIDIILYLEIILCIDIDMWSEKARVYVYVRNVSPVDKRVIF